MGACKLDFSDKALLRQWPSVVVGTMSVRWSLPEDTKEGPADRATQWQPLINFPTLLILAIPQEAAFQFPQHRSNDVQQRKLQSGLKGTAYTLMEKGSCAFLSWNYLQNKTSGHSMVLPSGRAPLPQHTQHLGNTRHSGVILLPEKSLSECRPILCDHLTLSGELITN